ncbi:MAG: ATP-dependent metallopeptidase FtsH/Yme1/Tma family protein, partial [Acidimicrobiales bacterium]
MKKRLSRPIIIYLVLAVAVLVVGMAWLNAGSGPNKVNLDEFRQLIADGKVQEATLKDKDHRVTGKLTSGEEFTVNFPAEYADELTQQLTDSDVRLTVDEQSESLWVSLLINFLPIVLLFGLFLLLMNSMQGGNKVMSFGKVKSKQNGPDQPKVNFADVAGADEAVD